MRRQLKPDGRLLIIGAGLAGYHTARNARINGHTGPITILGAEHHPAYDRPALSKSYLSGTIGEDDLLLDDPANPLEAERVTGADVIGLSTHPLGVQTAEGTFYPADAVVIATGAAATSLPHYAENGASAVAPFLLRTMDDALALRQTPLQGLHLAVVGGGFLALEAAATSTERGAASVTVAAGEHYPGARRLGLPVGQALRTAHEAHGVEFTPASRATRVESSVDGHRVRLADGGTVEADVVICAIGAAPTTGWLREGPVCISRTTGAVICDDTGYTGVPGVYAAGDCAQWDSQSKRLRPVGHWQEAVEQAGIVAAWLTGAPAQPLQEPYFWSDQYHLRLQGAGRISSANDVRVLDGSAEGGDLLVGYYRDDAEVGVLGINRLREVTRWRKQHRIKNAQALAA